MHLLSSPPRPPGKRSRNAVEVVLPSTTYRFRFQRSSDEPDVVVEHCLAYSVTSSVEWNSRRLNLDASERIRLEKFLLLEVIPLLNAKLRKTCDNQENATGGPAGPESPTDKNGDDDPKKRRTLAPSRYSARVNNLSVDSPIPIRLVDHVENKACRDADDDIMIDTF